MVIVYTRHSADCKDKAKGRDYRKCGCPLCDKKLELQDRIIVSSLTSRNSSVINK